MKFMYGVMIVLWGWSYVYAETPDHHEHVGSTQFKFNYELLDFENSKQKKDGRRYGVTVDHQDITQHFQLYVEHTDTQTKPVLPKDLSVNKYAFKYQYALSKAETLSFNYIQIDDNLVDAVDGGKVYGMGYRYKAFTLMQYMSDYTDFNVYQTDIKLGMKKVFSKLKLKGAVMGKYIYLQDRLSNNFTKKTEQNYFTFGAKIHAKYEGWHVAVVGYVGERIFAVMHEGLRVQHHAMAFQKSAMFSIGRKFDNVFVNVQYIKQYATEVPMENENVEVSNVIFSVAYTF